MGNDDFDDLINRAENAVTNMSRNIEHDSEQQAQHQQVKPSGHSTVSSTGSVQSSNRSNTQPVEHTTTQSDPHGLNMTDPGTKGVFQQWMQANQPSNAGVSTQDLSQAWNGLAQSVGPQQVAAATANVVSSMPTNERHDFVQQLLGLFHQNGVTPASAGVQNTNPNTMSSHDVGQLVGYAQQQQPGIMQQMFGQGGWLSNPAVQMALSGILAYAASQLFGGQQAGGAQSNPLLGLLTGSLQGGGSNPLSSLLGGGQQSGAGNLLGSLLGGASQQGNYNQPTTSNDNPLSALLGGGGQQGNSGNPLADLLGGGQSTNTNSNPLGGLMGGGGSSGGVDLTTLIKLFTGKEQQ